MTGPRGGFGVSAKRRISRGRTSTYWNSCFATRRSRSSRQWSTMVFGVPRRLPITPLNVRGTALTSFLGVSAKDHRSALATRTRRLLGPGSCPWIVTGM